MLAGVSCLRASALGMRQGWVGKYCQQCDWNLQWSKKEFILTLFLVHNSQGQLLTLNYQMRLLLVTCSESSLIIAYDKVCSFNLISHSLLWSSKERIQP